MEPGISVACYLVFLKRFIKEWARTTRGRSASWPTPPWVLRDHRCRAESSTVLHRPVVSPHRAQARPAPSRVGLVRRGLRGRRPDQGHRLSVIRRPSASLPAAPGFCRQWLAGTNFSSCAPEFANRGHCRSVRVPKDTTSDLPRHSSRPFE